MVLRLSSSATAVTTIPSFLEGVLQDTSLSQAEKTGGLKVLSVVVKNLVDPQKCQDVKYRTLKLDNVKLQQKLFRLPLVKELLISTLGFEETTNAEGVACLVVPNNPQFGDQTIWHTCLTELALTQDKLCQSSTTASSTSTTTNKKPKLETSSSTVSNASSSCDSLNSNTTPFSVGDDKLSEKQKARRMMEQKKIMERQKEKDERKRNLALLKQDKITRETDPNWKSGVSAACSKSGTGISTFRDKYGEADN